VTGNQGSIPEREPEKRLPHPRKAAGAQITHSQYGEVVTKNNHARPLTWAGNGNEINLNPLTRIHWRASLVPAAAVIPAPIAYIKVVAGKKLVVGSHSCVGRLVLVASTCPAQFITLGRHWEVLLNGCNPYFPSLL